MMQRQFSTLAMAIAIVVAAHLFAPGPFEDTDTGFDKMFDAVPVNTNTSADVAAIDLASIETAAGDEMPVTPEQQGEPAIVSGVAASVTTESEPQEPASDPDTIAAMGEGKDNDDVAAQACPAAPDQGSLTAFYQTSAATLSKESRALKVDTKAGMLSLAGVPYKLQYIELPKIPAIPLSSVSYPLEVRFVHESADGTKLVVSVPLKEGAANVAFESLLQGNDQVAFDPNDLLPADRHYTAFQSGKSCLPQTILLPKPVEISAAQIAKFHALF